MPHAGDGHEADTTLPLRRDARHGLDPVLGELDPRRADVSGSARLGLGIGVPTTTVIGSTAALRQPSGSGRMTRGSMAAV